MRPGLKWTILVGIVAAVVVTVIWLIYSREMRATEARVAVGSKVVETARGPIEFAAWGDGPPALVIHGAGGGYDQGRLMAEMFGGDGFRWIAPSRFGYLRTPLPADASTAAQADAFADLLDTLGIERVGVLAVSGGVPPALQFAERHAERVSALALVSSAPYTPLTAPDQVRPLPDWAYEMLFRSNFPFWVLQKTTPESLQAIFDVKPALLAEAPPEAKAAAAAMVETFQPVTGRIPGLGNEGAAIDPNATYALEAITAPTLVIHARDDAINPFAVGAYTAEHIPGAEFVPFDTGGHPLIGRHAEVRALVGPFLRKHGGENEPPP